MDSRSQNPVLLITVYDQTKASMLGALLEDSGIPYYIKDKGNGTYLRIYMGYSISGQDIYVPESTYETAKELLNTYFSTVSEEAESEFDDSEEQEALTSTTDTEFELAAKGFRTRRKLVARVFLILMVLSILMAAFLNRLDRFGWFSP